MIPHLLEINRSAAQQVTKCQLDVAIAGASVEETGFVELAFSNSAHEFAHADFAKLELGFGDELALALHHVGIA